MIEYQTSHEIDDAMVVLTPLDKTGDERRVSLVPNRPAGNSRPMGWMFIGGVMMPCSEHLIPFLH